MPSSRTHAHISMAAQGTQTLIKTNLFSSLSLNSLTVSFHQSLSLCVFLFASVIEIMLSNYKTDGHIPPVLCISALINITDTHMHIHKDGPSVPLRSGGHWQEVLFGRSDTISHIMDRKFGGVVYCSKVNMSKVQREPCF